MAIHDHDCHHFHVHVDVYTCLHSCSQLCSCLCCKRYVLSISNYTCIESARRKVLKKCSIGAYAIDIAICDDYCVLVHCTVQLSARNDEISLS